MKSKVSNTNSFKLFYANNKNTEFEIIFIDKIRITKNESKYDQDITYDMNGFTLFKQGTLILDFLTADFTTEQLADNTFFNKFNNLKDKIKSFTSLSEMSDFQKKFRDFVDFTFFYEVSSIGYDVKFKEYMRHADYNKSLQYLRDDVEVMLDTPVVENTEGSLSKSEEEVKETLQYTNDVYLIKSLPALLYISLKEYVTFRNMPIRKCKNCDRYFIAQNRKDELYCTRLYKDTNKTCKQIGSALIYLERLGNEPALTMYRNMNKKKHMQILRKPDDKKLAEKFEKWKIDAKQQYSEYKNKKLTDEEFIKWLSLNDY